MTATPSATFHRFQFHGKAIEFFRIWIVNIILTVLTLGIYSAWAKVRTQKYLMRNLELDGHRFDYTAEPMQILKGRLIAVGLLLALSLLQKIVPAAGSLASLLFMLIIPAIIVMSLAFRLRVTTYRGIAFGFQRDFVRAYLIYGLPVLLMALMFLITFLYGPRAPRPGMEPEFPALWLAGMGSLMLVLALGFPAWEWWLKHFIGTRARYGTTHFNYEAPVKAYYGLYTSASLTALVLLVALTLLFGGIVQLAGTLPAIPGAWITSALPIALTCTLVWWYARIHAGRINLFLDNLSLDGHRVRSRVTTGAIFWLYVTNTLAILVSLGLLIPWAQIRTLRYRASVTGLLAHSPLDTFVAEQQTQVSALGEEIGDVFDVEVGL